MAEHENAVQLIIKCTEQYKVCNQSACFKPNFFEYATDSACGHVLWKRNDDFNCVKTFDLISS